MNLAMARPPGADGMDSGAAGGQHGLQLAVGPAAVITSQEAVQVPAPQAPALQAADATQQQVGTSRLQTKVAMLLACLYMCSGNSAAKGGCRRLFGGSCCTVALPWGTLNVIWVGLSLLRKAGAFAEQPAADDPSRAVHALGPGQGCM